jgi:hypothetical protein
MANHYIHKELEKGLYDDRGANKPLQVLVKNVLSVPQLKGYLLTVKRLIDLGLNVNCGNNKCDIMAR